MKKVIVSALATIIVLSTFQGLHANEPGTCLTTCTSSDGYNVRILQSSTGWEMRVYDGDDVVGEYDGSGQYSGTICGGILPCQA